MTRGESTLNKGSSRHGGERAPIYLDGEPSILTLKSGAAKMKRITVVVTDRLYDKLEYLRKYWGMDSWAKVLENLVKITESLMSDDTK